MNFPLRTFKIGTRHDGRRMLHFAGCTRLSRYREPPEYWWTDEHALSLYLYCAEIQVCGSCLPKEEIEREFISWDHLQRLEPIMRHQRIEEMLGA